MGPTALEQFWTAIGIIATALLAFFARYVWPGSKKVEPESVSTVADLVKVVSELIRMQDVIEQLEKDLDNRDNKIDGQDEIISDLKVTLDDCLELVSNAS